MRGPVRWPSLLGEGPPFEHRFQTAAGALAHKAIELDVGREREDASPDLVDRAAERLAERDGSFAAYWERHRRHRALRGVRGGRPAGRAVPGDVPAAAELVDPGDRVVGPAEFGDVIGLGAGRPGARARGPEEPMRARRIALDLKSGRAWPEFPEDMRLYALLLTLRHGVPPFRVASVFLDSGEWQAEDVEERTLFHAADRLVAAVRSAAELLAGTEPRLEPRPLLLVVPPSGDLPGLRGIRAASDRAM